MSSPSTAPPTMKRKQPIPDPDIQIIGTVKKPKIHHDKLQNALKEYTDKCTNLGRDGLRSYQAIIESGFIKDIDLLNVTVEEYPSEEEAQEVWDSRFEYPILSEIDPEYWIIEIKHLIHRTKENYDIDVFDIKDEVQKRLSPREETEDAYDSDPDAEGEEQMIEVFLKDMDLYLKNLFVQCDDYWSLKMEEADRQFLKDWRLKFKYLPAWGRDYYGTFRNFCEF